MRQDREKIDRERLVEIVTLIMTAAADTEAEEDRLLREFRESVPHPRPLDLIFYPENEFGPSARENRPSAEEIVHRALSYRPIQL